MNIVALDSSVIVAALLDGHEHHASALPLVQEALKAPRNVVVPVPALVESYSVMTRLPPPWRVRADDARHMLSATFQGRAILVALDGAEVWTMLASLGSSGVVGGATYDAHIAACAMKARATHLATFNRRHFERFDLGAMTLLTPPRA